jgi:uncharacterized Zn ribbon protein
MTPSRVRGVTRSSSPAAYQRVQNLVSRDLMSVSLREGDAMIVVNDYPMSISVTELV